MNSAVVDVAKVCFILFDVSNVTCTTLSKLRSLLIVLTKCVIVSALPGVPIAKSGRSSLSTAVSAQLVGNLENASAA